ncbi:hypothetical protein [Pseudomonas caspiana]|uniref:Uncharacterized protein n=1 Tax=Pseudomonas caspiana TaxID=1451454 RepID=A0A1Y3NT66_9PSED|nr:hypothetical protein [Pseudomonas caspiana]OUM70820.1 hypothetical protein AUC60_26580 [Pseudomonas caspiana]
MRKPISVIRLSPEAAGDLNQKYLKADSALKTLNRYQRELDKQLKALIGQEALRELQNATENALLLADLVKEAA